MFIICAEVEAMYSATGLIKETGMLSNPMEQSFRMFFIIFSTSSLFVCCSINCSVDEPSGSAI